MTGEGIMTKWHDVECISEVKPPVRESESSSKVVYLRKGFVFHEGYTDEEGKEVPAKWTYKETTLPKDVIDLLAMTDENTEGIAGLEDALCELSMEE